MRIRLLTVLALLLLPMGPSAQVSYLWSPAELTEKSLIVVLATPMKTWETGVKTTLTDLKPPFPVVELQTEFKVLSTLKGELPRPTFTLLHYRADIARLRGGTIGGAGALPAAEVGAHYLLFLRRDSDGFLIPTSGHVSPADSVFTVRKAG